MKSLRNIQGLKAMCVVPIMMLAACDNAKISGTPPVPVYEDYIQQALKADTQIKFQLQGQDATLDPPTFLLLDTTTGRLNIPTTNNDPSNPIVAINQSDGWGPTEPIAINFTGKNLDPTSVTGSFHMIEISDPLTTPPNEQRPEPLTVTYNPQMPDPMADLIVFVDPSNPAQLAVLPQRPLDPVTNYMFAITNDLKDTDGNSVGFTGSYAALKSTTPTVITQLTLPQQIIQLADTLFSSGGLNKETIIYSTWFTTGSAGDVLYGTKGISAGAVEAILNGQTADLAWKGTANPRDIDLDGMYEMEITEKDDSEGDYTLYKGIVKLPHFLDRTVENDLWKKTPWGAGMPSIAMLLDAVTNGSVADQATLAQQLAALELSVQDIINARTDPAAQAKVVRGLTGAKLTRADGSQLDSERVITRYNPIPQVRYLRSIPFIAATPSTDRCPNLMPANIYVHGITAFKETMAFLLDNFIGDDCLAMFAIDLPLHGQRLAPDGTVTNPQNPQVFLNLEYLTVGRDNVRQAIVDQIALRVALGFQIQFNQSRPIDEDDPLTRITNVGSVDTGVSLVGHSLGAIVGLSYAGVINRPVTENPPFEQIFFESSRVAAANPGGTIAYFLLDSMEFGDLLKDSVLSKIYTPYIQYKAQSCTPQDIDGPMCFAMYYASLDPTQKAPVIAIMTQFAFAAETVITPADPASLIAQAPSDMPIFMTMVQNDTVIPNRMVFGVSDVYSAVAGTLPLIWNNNFTQILDSVATPSRDAALFNQGQHASFITGGTAGEEMQKQISSFFNTGEITVTDPSLLYRQDP